MPGLRTMGEEADVRQAPILAERRMSDIHPVAGSGSLKTMLDPLSLTLGYGNADSAGHQEQAQGRFR